MSQPPLSPEELAAAEAQLAQNPGDLNLRLRVLTHYRDTAPMGGYDDPVKRSTRLRHIMYVIENNANVADPASPLVYVPRAAGPYANESDHEMVRSLWIRLAETNPADQRLVLNAAWFLFVEDKPQATDLLTRAVERQPDNQRIAANLGFMYAMQILGLDGWRIDFDATRFAERAGAKESAIAALEKSSNAAVLAGAATGIPNLAIRASRGGQVDPELFQLASKLMAKARALAPEDDAFLGPMPMIDYFQENQRLATDRNLSGRARAGQGDVAGMSPSDFQRLPNIPANRVSGTVGRPASGGDKEIDYIEKQPSTAPIAPSRIRVGESVQKARLTFAPAPKYTGEAAAISGEVRFDAIIAADGTVSALTLRSGHPLLVPLALEAVKQWRYQPTIVYSTPVEVQTDVVVTFPPPK